MAYTELYVRSDANGSGNGTTDANSGANGSFTWAQMLADTTSGSVRYNVKAGTYARTTSADTFTTAGTSTNPRAIRGFNSAAGDLASNGRTTGGSLVTTNYPAITYTTGGVTLPANFVLEYVSLSASNKNGAPLTTVSTDIVRRCDLSNTTAVGASVACIAPTNSLLIDNDYTQINASNTAAGAVNIATGTTMVGGLIVGSNSGCAAIKILGNNSIRRVMIRDFSTGIAGAAAVCYVSGCSFRNISVTCFDNACTGAMSIDNCVAWGAAGSSVFYNSTTNPRQAHLGTNGVGNFGSADVNLGEVLDVGRIALTADPFTSSTVLTLNSTAGGGAALKAVGDPANLDLGANQTASVSGSISHVIGG